MSPVLIAGFLWVVASAITAMLPMRYQYPPGIALLVAAPVLIAWLGFEHGWVAAVLALAAFASMFRHPLRYLVKRAAGRPIQRSEEPTK